MKPGMVFLVGAGPGDPDLLTRKALRVIGSAEVVVFDRLVSEDVLALVPKGAARIDVGKQPRLHPVPQEEINRTLVALGRAGRRVARLKGGDPFVFGRGGEEAIALAAAGIPFEIVPGITSAQGCAAAMRMPLTHRGLATGLRFLTGHCRGDDPLDFDWNGLVDPCTTLVVYMGLANIREIAGELVAHGRAPSTPVLAISRGTLPDQRQLTSTLATVGEDVDLAKLATPTLFIIGEIVSLIEILGVEKHGETMQRQAAAY